MAKKKAVVPEARQPGPPSARPLLAATLPLTVVALAGFILTLAVPIAVARRTCRPPIYPPAII